MVKGAIFFINHLTLPDYYSLILAPRIFKSPPKLISVFPCFNTTFLDELNSIDEDVLDMYNDSFARIVTLPSLTTRTCLLYTSDAADE